MDFKDWLVKPQYDDRDFRFSILADKPKLKETRNARYFHKIARQLNGSCTGEANANNVFLKTDDFCSGEFIYQNAKKHDEFPGQEGSSILAASKALNKYGTPLKHLYPTQPADTPYTAYPEPTQECVADALTRRSTSYFRATTAEEYSEGVAQHGGVVLAMKWTTSCDYPEIDPKTGMAFMPIPEGSDRGGHAVFGCECYPDLEYRYSNGTIEKGFGAIVNSHGVGWGRRGIALFPLRLIELKMLDFPIPYVFDMRVNVMEGRGNAEVIDIDVSPTLLNDRTWLPMRALAESLGYQVDYYHPSKMISMTNGYRKANFVVDSTSAYIDGEKHELTDAPFIAQDRVFLPVRGISELLGSRVDWDNGRVEIINKDSVVMFIGDKYLIKRYNVDGR